LIEANRMPVTDFWFTSTSKAKKTESLQPSKG